MRRSPVSLALLSCLAAPLAAESQAAPPPEPDAMAAALGAKVFAENCGRCHLAPDPATHSRREWVAISLHMRVFADLSQDEQRRVLMFLRTYNTARMKHEAGVPASHSAAPTTRNPAMTRHLLLLPCFTLLLASGASLRAQDWVAPKAEADAADPVPDNKTSRSAGKSVFEQYCLTCHGPEGKGDGPGGQYLTPKPGDLSDPRMWGESDGSLHWKIITGRTAMPSFKYFLNEQQRWQVVRYLRTFAPQPKSADAPSAAPTAAATTPPKPQ